jgi:hypothetical protein
MVWVEKLEDKLFEDGFQVFYKQIYMKLHCLEHHTDIYIIKYNINDLFLLNFTFKLQIEFRKFSIY